MTNKQYITFIYKVFSINLYIVFISRLYRNLRLEKNKIMVWIKKIFDFFFNISPIQCDNIDTVVYGTT